MNRTILRIVFGVIWLIGGVVSLLGANYPMALIFIFIGVVFLLAATKDKKSSNKEK